MLLPRVLYGDFWAVPGCAQPAPALDLQLCAVLGSSPGTHMLSSGLVELSARHRIFLYDDMRGLGSRSAVLWLALDFVLKRTALMVSGEPLGCLGLSLGHPFASSRPPRCTAPAPSSGLPLSRTLGP